MKMRIAIIGSGGIGLLTAVLAVEQGHTVGILAPRGAPRVGTIKDGYLTFKAVGVREMEISVMMLSGPTDLSDWDIVVIAIPGTAYEGVLPQVVQHLRSEQIVVCSGALSLVPIWIREQAKEFGISPTIATWGTTAGTGHPNSDRTLQIGTVRGPFEMAILPRSDERNVMAKLASAFGLKYNLVPSTLIPLLSNINPIAHAGQTIPNLSRMEKGEAWHLFGNFRDVGGRIAEEIDSERLAIAKGFGVHVRGLRLHYHLSYHVPNTTLPDIANAILVNGRGISGPSVLAHRFLDEDVPFGLVVYELLGNIASVPTPATSAAITILSLATGHNYRKRNKIIADMNLSTMNREKLTKRVSCD